MWIKFVTTQTYGKIQSLHLWFTSPTLTPHPHHKMQGLHALKTIVVKYIIIHYVLNQNTFIFVNNLPLGKLLGQITNGFLLLEKKVHNILKALKMFGTLVCLKHSIESNII